MAVTILRIHAYHATIVEEGHLSVLPAPVGTIALVPLTRCPVLWGTGVVCMLQAVPPALVVAILRGQDGAAVLHAQVGTTVQVCFHSNHYCPGMFP